MVCGASRWSSQDQPKQLNRRDNRVRDDKSQEVFAASSKVADSPSLPFDEGRSLPERVTLVGSCRRRPRGRRSAVDTDDRTQEYFPPSRAEWGMHKLAGPLSICTASAEVLLVFLSSGACVCVSFFFG